MAQCYLWTFRFQFKYYDPLDASLLGVEQMETEKWFFIRYLLSGDFIFILQSLTTWKMRKCQTLKLSQFHKAKTCWTENWWSSGIMSNLWRQFFMFWGAKFFFLNIVASALKSCIKWSLKDICFFLNLIMNFKKELSPSEPLLYSTQLPILSILYYLANVKNK